jgi:TonB family protein
VQARPEPRPEPVDTRAIEPTAPLRETIPPSPPREAAPTPPSPVPHREAPPPTVFAPSLESAYVGRLRTYLEGIKRYPTSREARSQRPQGKVRVWLELARDGHLRDAGVEQSSGSMILDGAAMSTVRRGNYPAIPAEACGEAQSIPRSFEGPARHQHENEDRHLFPLLERRIARGEELNRFRALRATFAAQHREIDACWAKLAKPLHTIAEGLPKSLNAAHVQAFRAICATHILAEDAALTHLMERYLSPIELRPS